MLEATAAHRGLVLFYYFIFLEGLIKNNDAWPLWVSEVNWVYNTLSILSHSLFPLVRNNVQQGCKKYKESVLALNYGHCDFFK